METPGKVVIDLTGVLAGPQIAYNLLLEKMIKLKRKAAKITPEQGGPPVRFTIQVETRDETRDEGFKELRYINRRNKTDKPATKKVINTIILKQYMSESAEPEIVAEHPAALAGLWLSVYAIETRAALAFEL